MTNKKGVREDNKALIEISQVFSTEQKVEVLAKEIDALADDVDWIGAAIAVLSEKVKALEAKFDNEPTE